MKYLWVSILILSFIPCHIYSQTNNGKLRSSTKAVTKDTLVHDFVNGQAKIAVDVPDSVRVVLSNQSTDSFWIRQLPWLVAAAISIITILINIFINIYQRGTTFKLAVIQHNSNIASKNRQDWINTVRDCVSEILTNLGTYNMKIASMSQLQIGQAKIETWEETKKIMFYRWKSKLLLNSSGEKPEDDHIELDNALDSIFNYAIQNYANFNDEKYKNMVEKIEIVTQKIIKKEWDRIGKFEEEVEKLLNRRKK